MPVHVREKVERVSQMIQIRDRLVSFGDTTIPFSDRVVQFGPENIPYRDRRVPFGSRLVPLIV